MVGRGNSKLEIANNSIKFITLTTKVIGKDTLLFIDTTEVDWVLRSVFTYDCLAGLTLEFGNQNGVGGRGSINAFLQVEAYVDSRVDFSDLDADGF